MITSPDIQENLPTESPVDPAARKRLLYFGLTFGGCFAIIVIIATICFILLFQGCLRRAYYTLATVGISSIALSPDNTMIAVSGSSGGPRCTVWVLSESAFTSDKMITINPSRNHILSSLTFSPDSKSLAAISHDRQRITLWDVETGNMKWEDAYPEDFPLKASLGGFTPDGQYILAGFTISVGRSKTCVVVLLDSNTGKVLKEFKPDFDIGSMELVALELSHDGEYCAAIVDLNPGKDEKEYGVCLWDWKNDQNLREKKFPFAPLVSFNPVNNHILTASQKDGKFVKWNWKEDETKHDFSLKKLNEYGKNMAPHELKITPNGKKIIAAIEDNIFVFDYDTGKEINVFGNKNYYTAIIKMSNDGKHFLSCQRFFRDSANPDRYLIDYWNIETGKIEKRIRPNW